MSLHPWIGNPAALAADLKRTQHTVTQSNLRPKHVVTNEGTNKEPVRITENLLRLANRPLRSQRRG